MANSKPLGKAPAFIRPARRLSRRALLGGLGGVALGLPMLEIMLDGRGISLAADPPTVPKRYLVCFGGQSLGSDCDTVHNLYVPDTVGPNYDLKEALKPLAPVQSEVTVVS